MIFVTVSDYHFNIGLSIDHGNHKYHVHKLTEDNVLHRNDLLGFDCTVLVKKGFMIVSLCVDEEVVVYNHLIHFRLD